MKKTSGVKEEELVITPDDPFYAFAAYSMGHMTEDQARRYVMSLKDHDAEWDSLIEHVGHIAASATLASNYLLITPVNAREHAKKRISFELKMIAESIEAIRKVNKSLVE